MTRLSQGYNYENNKKTAKYYQYNKNAGNISRLDISKALKEKISISTLNRELLELVEKNYLTKTGKGRGVKYSISSHYDIFKPVNIKKYFELEPGAREAKTTFNFVQKSRKDRTNSYFNPLP